MNIVLGSVYETMSISIRLYPNLDLWNANKLHYITLHSPPSSTEVNNVWSFTFIPFIHTVKKKSQNTYSGKFNINVLNNSISVQLFTIILLCISGNSPIYYPVVLKCQKQYNMGKLFVLPTTDPIFPSWLPDPFQMLVHLTLEPRTHNKS